MMKDDCSYRCLTCRTLGMSQAALAEWASSRFEMAGLLR
jgi:hypothetical protein